MSKVKIDDGKIYGLKIDRPEFAESLVQNPSQAFQDFHLALPGQSKGEATANGSIALPYFDPQIITLAAKHFPTTESLAVGVRTGVRFVDPDFEWDLDLDEEPEPKTLLEITQFRNLKRLSLDVADADLSFLAELPKLESLQLASEITTLNFSGNGSWQGLRQLKFLEIAIPDSYGKPGSAVAYPWVPVPGGTSLGGLDSDGTWGEVPVEMDDELPWDFSTDWFPKLETITIHGSPPLSLLRKLVQLPNIREIRVHSGFSGTAFENQFSTIGSTVSLRPRRESIEEPEFLQRHRRQARERARQRCLPPLPNGH